MIIVDDAPYRYEIGTVCMVVYRYNVFTGGFVKINVLDIQKARNQYADIFERAARNNCDGLTEAMDTMAL